MTAGHRELAEACLAMLNRHDLDAVGRFMAVGYINHKPAHQRRPRSQPRILARVLRRLPTAAGVTAQAVWLDTEGNQLPVVELIIECARVARTPQVRAPH